MQYTDVHSHMPIHKQNVTHDQLCETLANLLHWAKKMNPNGAKNMFEAFFQENGKVSVGF